MFNQMEDMKGKIRVYARVRPILAFETAQVRVSAAVMHLQALCCLAAFSMSCAAMCCVSRKASALLLRSSHQQPCNAHIIMNQHS